MHPIEHMDTARTNVCEISVHTLQLYISFQHAGLFFLFLKMISALQTSFMSLRIKGKCAKCETS